MNIFNLPDLGEGLPDAEIHEWFVKEGDLVKLDAPLVSMETAKAVVDVPAPRTGVIAKLYGKKGDIIKTGSPLVSFVEEAQNVDKGTVVGHLEEHAEIGADEFTIGSSHKIKIAANARLLAKKLKIDYGSIKGSGALGLITKQDIEEAFAKTQVLREGYTALKGVRRAMLTSMVNSHQEVVAVSIFDEADINHWPKSTDITINLIKAIIYASKKEPAMNAWFDGTHGAIKSFETVNLGLAMDSKDGLFVPVIHSVEKESDDNLRKIINRLKEETATRSLDPESLKNATITLSNFGKFAGKFASPIIVPPTVAIIGVGKLYLKATCTESGVHAHKTLPISLSFDHRAATGGEATRFLGAMIEYLENN